MSTEELPEKRAELLSVIRAREIELLRMRRKRRSGLLPLLASVVATTKGIPISEAWRIFFLGREDFDQ